MSLEKLERLYEETLKSFNESTEKTKAHLQLLGSEIQKLKKPSEPSTVKGMVVLGQHIYGVDLKGNLTKLLESPLNSNKTSYDGFLYLKNAVSIKGTIYCYNSWDCSIMSISQSDWKISVFNSENWSTASSLFKSNDELYAIGNKTYKFNLKNGRYEEIYGNLGAACVPAIYGDFIYYTTGSPTALNKMNLKTGKIDIIEIKPIWGAGRMLLCQDKIYLISNVVYEIDPKTDKYQTCSRDSLVVKGACVVGNKLAVLHKPDYPFHSKLGYIQYTQVALFDPETGKAEDLTKETDYEKPILNLNHPMSGAQGCESISEWTD